MGQVTRGSQEHQSSFRPAPRWTKAGERPGGQGPRTGLSRPQCREPGGPRWARQSRAVGRHRRRREARPGVCVCVGGVRAEAPRGWVPFRANGSNGRPGSSARQAERAAPRRQDPGAGAERRRAGREGGGCKSLSFLNSPPPALGSPLGSARRRLCPVDRPHHPLPGRRPPDTAFLPKRPTRARAEAGGRALTVDSVRPPTDTTSPSSTW